MPRMGRKPHPRYLLLPGRQVEQPETYFIWRLISAPVYIQPCFVLLLIHMHVSCWPMLAALPKAETHMVPCPGFLGQSQPGHRRLWGGGFLSSSHLEPGPHHLQAEDTGPHGSLFSSFERFQWWLITDLLLTAKPP